MEDDAGGDAGLVMEVEAGVRADTIELNDPQPHQGNQWTDARLQPKRVQKERFAGGSCKF